MKVQALILSAVTALTMCAPAFAHCHGGWGGYGYGYGPRYYAGNQGFLSYLINGNPPGYSYFRRGGYGGYGGGYGGPGYGWGRWGDHGRHLGWYRHGWDD